VLPAASTAKYGDPFESGLLCWLLTPTGCRSLTEQLRIRHSKIYSIGKS